VYSKSNGHMTDDVTWPRKVKVVIQFSLGPNISKMAGDRAWSQWGTNRKRGMGSRMVT